MIDHWVSVLSGKDQGIITLVTAFALGFLGLATSCCNLPVFAAIVGYSGTMTAETRKKNLLASSLFFLLGIIITMLLLGIVLSLSGQLLLSGAGRYWKLIAGCLFLFFGLSALGLVNIRLAPMNHLQRSWKPGLWPAFLFGMALSGSTAVCNTLCNPVFSITLGAAFVHNNMAWASMIMLFFSLGFGLPLAAGMAGLSLGMNLASLKFRRISGPVKYIGGIILLACGFYFLIS